MNPKPRQLDGVRTLVAGASSGIGRAFARAAHHGGARVAVAARRKSLLDELAREIDGTAHQLDITDVDSIKELIVGAVESLGAIDVLVCTSGVLPFARVEHIDASTWSEALAVNAVGPTLLISSALPHLASGSVILVVTSDEERRARTGTAAYSASKAALDEILRSWRYEHPHLRIIRVALGPIAGTEILRGADQDLLTELMEEWSHQGQIPEELADVAEIAQTLTGIVASARDNPKLLTDNIRLVTKG